MTLKGYNGVLEINIIRRSNPQCTEYWDANWIEAYIEIEIHNFKGHYSTYLRSDDFERFYKELERLSTNQSKEAEFTTMEEGLYLKGILGITGNIKWSVVSKLSLENSLNFVIETDYASIDNLLEQVSKILNEYPVIG